MHRNKRKRFSFSRLKQAIGNLWKKKQPGVKAFFPPGALYLHIRDLPFDIFIACTVHGRYELLIRNGKLYIPDMYAELIEAWTALQLQYIDAIEEQETIYVAQLEKQINLLYNYITTIETTCYLLSIVYDERLVQILKDNGFNYAFDEADPEKNKRFFENINNRLSKSRLDFKTKQIELEELVRNRTQSEKPSEKHFKSMLIRLSRFMGGPVIKAKNITTEEYCDMFREYVSDIDQEKKALEKHGNKRNH